MQQLDTRVKSILSPQRGCQEVVSSSSSSGCFYAYEFKFWNYPRPCGRGHGVAAMMDRAA